MSDFRKVSEFTVGLNLALGWAVMWKKPMLFLMITLLYLITDSVLTYVLKGFFGPEALLLNMLLVLLFVGFIALFFWGAIIYAVFMLLVNGSVSVSEAFQRSASRFFTVIMGSFVIIFLTWCVMLIIPLFVLSLIPENLVFIAAMIIMPVGLIFGSMLIAKWFVLYEACIIEKTGVIEGLKRSSELTNGYRLKIFGIFFIATSLLMIVVIIPRLAFGNGLSGVIFSILTMIIPYTYALILLTIPYYSLRAVKENLMPDSLLPFQNKSNMQT